MIELDGIEYLVQTPEENAYDMIQYINEYCATNQVKNIKGELIYIEANPSNPLYIILFGLCFLVSTLQKLIYSAGCALSVSSSSDRQLLNIAQIARVHRRAATKTTITCTVYAEANANCSITRDLTVTYNAGDATLVFSPTFEVTITAGGAANIILIANTYGAYSISAGAITSFDTPVAGMASMTSYDSAPGQEQETIASLRQRIQSRILDSTQIDRCIDDIVSLDGVAMCNIFYNYSSVSPVVVRGISVPPRQALLVVQGYSDQIAQTFFNHLLCLTLQTPSSITQNYTTKAGQQLPVYITPPELIPLYIRLYVHNDLTTAQQKDICNAVLALGASLVIGQELSAYDIASQIAKTLPEIDIESAQLSTDDQTYTYKIIPSAIGLLSMNSTRIQIEEE